jgi:hypothetical protein
VTEEPFPVLRTYAVYYVVHYLIAVRVYDTLLVSEVVHQLLNVPYNVGHRPLYEVLGHLAARHVVYLPVLYRERAGRLYELVVPDANGFCEHLWVAYRSGYVYPLLSDIKEALLRITINVNGPIDDLLPVVLKCPVVRLLCKQLEEPVHLALVPVVLLEQLHLRHPLVLTLLVLYRSHDCTLPPRQGVEVDRRQPLREPDSVELVDSVILEP